MKKTILALLFLTAVSFVHACELEITGYIKPDPIRGNNHYFISNDDGNAKGGSNWGRTESTD